MTAYILSRAAARSMVSTWFSSGLLLSDSVGIHRLFSMFTVYDPSGTDSARSLRELTSSDEVRIFLTPGHEVEQEQLVPYGAILKNIVDVASKATAFSSDIPASFVIVYE